MHNEPDDTARLFEIARIAGELELTHVRDDALAAAQRVAEGQFYVACVGQFKRGKSTLIDALLDDPVLPSGIVPVTTVPTVVRYGDRRSARVRMRARMPDDGAVEWQPIAPDDLSLYVSEEHNPENERGVLGVEVFVPSPLLRSGMCLVDTPGLGSVFEANTEATRAFIPHIDAAIAVIGADPPISGSELDLIEDVSRQVEHLIIVMNKADRVSGEERSVAADFARAVIGRRIQRSVDRVYCVSATERLSRSGPARDWSDFVSALEILGNESARQLVAASGQRAIARLAQAGIAAIQEERDALLRPAAESEARIERLRDVVEDGQRAMLDLGPLFAAEQQRLSRRFAAERTEFLDAATSTSRDQLARELALLKGNFGPALRRTMMQRAQATAHRALDPWFTAQQDVADAAYSESMSRFVGIGNDFLERLARTGVPELQAVPGALDGDAGLPTRSHFVFNEVITVAQPASPVRLAADVALGLVARGAIERDAIRFLEWLLEMNSSRVQSDVDQRVAEGRRALESAIRRLLTDVESRAKRALARANQARAEGSTAIESALARLDENEAALKRIAGHRVL